MRLLPTTTSGEQKASHVDATKASADRLLTLKASGVHELMGGIAAQLRKNAW